MSLLPRFLPLDIWNSFPSRSFDPFRRGFEDDLARMALRSWMDPEILDRYSPFDECMFSIKNKDNFEASIKCENYQPDEIKVKVADGFLVVEGKHEKKSNNSYRSHNFTQRIFIPENVIQDTFACNMNKDGVLKITAKTKKQEPAVENAKEIPILMEK